MPQSEQQHLQQLRAAVAAAERRNQSNRHHHNLRPSSFTSTVAGPPIPSPPLAVNLQRTRQSRRHSISPGAERQGPTVLGSFPSTDFYADWYTVRRPGEAQRYDRYNSDGRRRSMPETLSQSRYQAILTSEQLQRELAQNCQMSERSSITYPTIRGQEVQQVRSSRWSAARLKAWVRRYIFERVLFTPSWRRIRRHPTAAALSMSWGGFMLLLLLLLQSRPRTVWDPYQPATASGPQNSLSLILPQMNDELAGVIEQSINMRVLPHFIRQSATSIAHLQAIISYTDIKSRAELDGELKEYYMTAQESVQQLLVFFIRVSSLVQHVIRTTNSTVTEIDNVYARHKGRCDRALAVTTWVDKSVGMLPFSGNRLCSIPMPQIVRPIHNHIQTILPELELRLSEATPLLRRFDRLQELLATIRLVALQDSVQVNHQRATVIQERSIWRILWMKVGGAARDGSDLLEEQARTLMMVPEYLQDAHKTVDHMVVSLTDMHIRFDVLSTRLVGFETSRSLNANYLPSGKDLDDMRVSMNHLKVLHNVMKLKESEEMQEVFRLGRPNASLHDYYQVKAGGRIKYGTEGFGR